MMSRKSHTSEEFSTDASSCRLFTSNGLLRAFIVDTKHTSSIQEPWLVACPAKPVKGSGMGSVPGWGWDDAEPFGLPSAKLELGEALPDKPSAEPVGQAEEPAERPAERPTVTIGVFLGYRM